MFGIFCLNIPLVLLRIISWYNYQYYPLMQTRPKYTLSNFEKGKGKITVISIIIPKLFLYLASAWCCLVFNQIQAINIKVSFDAITYTIHTFSLLLAIKYQ